MRLLREGEQKEKEKRPGTALYLYSDSKWLVR